MRFIYTVLFLLAGILSTAQILTPAKWVYSISNDSPAVGEEIELIFSATIEKNWYLYSNEFPCEDGPIKTTITLKPHPGYKLVGSLRPINPVEKHDKIFECDVKIFVGAGEIRQKIKILKANAEIAGESEYEVC